MNRMKSSLTTAVSAATALALIAGCSSSKSSDAGGSTSASASTASATTSASTAAISGTIVVLAASSLTESFTTLAKSFEAAHPGTTVKLSFAASSALATQITSGAPADVFASASTKNMTQVTSAGDASNPTNFASNTMEIAVPPSNPAKVTGLADLAKSSVKVALCQTQVPCGATAATVFKNANLTVKPVTLEPDVKSTLTKVELKEVDAGVVYVSDVKAAGSKVTGILIPADVNATTEYPIAALTKAPNPAGAAAFVALVLSAEGTAALAGDGFAKP
ncbi:MAG: molybdenum transporter, periplasmic molybdate-binding protein [Frankiales bacterium]|nr:molybdenum transporter, periplasmic molybdate-binding protein [Frankiales bacterium]